MTQMIDSIENKALDFLDEGGPRIIGAFLLVLLFVMCAIERTYQCLSRP